MFRWFNGSPKNNNAQAHLIKVWFVSLVQWFTKKQHFIYWFSS